MSLTVLSVSYPLARVSPDATGGSEQILSILDRALVAAGHRSIVVAPEGSRVAGELLPIAWPEGVLDDAVKCERAGPEPGRDSDRAGPRSTVDLVHLHGIDFDRYLPAPGPPVLATLHLPPAWYPREALHPRRPDTWLNGVSASQHAACPTRRPACCRRSRTASRYRNSRRAMPSVVSRCFLGRICPEKGVHLALQAARRANTCRCLWRANSTPMRRIGIYFEAEVRPLLDRQHRFIGPGGVRTEAAAAHGSQVPPPAQPRGGDLVARGSRGGGLRHGRDRHSQWRPARHGSAGPDRLPRRDRGRHGPCHRGV